jgi:hypothetical protein
MESRTMRGGWSRSQSDSDATRPLASATASPVRHHLLPPSPSAPSAAAVAIHAPVRECSAGKAPRSLMPPSALSRRQVRSRNARLRDNRRWEVVSGLWYAAGWISLGTMGPAQSRFKAKLIIINYSGALRFAQFYKRGPPEQNYFKNYNLDTY